MLIFRPARKTDLRQLYEVFYQNEVLDHPSPPAPGETPSYLHHVLETGTLQLAEQDGEVLAFAGAITRGGVSFLTDLFVRPAHQSAQLGQTLLHTVFPPDDLVHCTASSSDYRALALYIRAGMRPLWPLFALQLEKLIQEMPSSDVEIVEADPADTELVRWDAQIGGRLRSADHQYWIREQQAIPLWFRRHKQIVGYGYVRLKAGTVWHPHACTLGPIGVTTPADAINCVLALVNLALEHAHVVTIEVPGPHPCLATLLESGFRIQYVDTFVSTTTSPFFDGQCYIPSGGDLL